ncbi:hypothetical protein Gpo141_00014121, partial [Globisporangium polare]
MDNHALTVDPLTILELHFRRAIIAVLGKTRWWIKWQDPVIRAKWLAEIQSGFLGMTYAQCFVWPVRKVPTLTGLLRIARKEHSLRKEARAQEWCRFVRYESQYNVGKYRLERPGVPGERGSMIEFSPFWDECEHPEDGGECDHRPRRLAFSWGGLTKRAKNEKEKPTSEEDAENPKARSFDWNMETWYTRKTNAYEYIRWYVAIASLRDKLVALPVREWTTKTLAPMIKAAKKGSDPETRARFVNFIQSLPKQGELTDEDIQAALGGSDSEIRPKVLGLLRGRAQLIQAELALFEQHLVQAIDSYAAGVVDSGELGAISPTGIFGTWGSDNAIPSNIKFKFAAEVSVLENVPEHLKDWHPNTKNQVLDVVHPSLFCCVFGKTERILQAPAPDSFKDPAEQMATIMFAATQCVERPVGTKQRWNRNMDNFQWIPSDFHINEDDGSVRILSYINNLHPARHASLYNSIEAIFARFVPMFERALSSDKETTLEPQFDVPECAQYREDRPDFPDSSSSLGSLSPTVKLGGRTVQVIVKIAEIVLTPESRKYPGGSWHIEATDAEQIVATGIYYFACDNIRESKLSFRVKTHGPKYEQSDDAGVAAMYGMENHARLVQPLGSLHTMADRCLVFPNGVQHKVEPFELEDPSKPGVRKILAFFLVHPDKTIPSTAVIPPQQQEWIEAAEVPLLKRMKLVESVESEIREFLSSNEMSLEDARKYREQLMECRSRSAKYEDNDLEEFSL